MKKVTERSIYNLEALSTEYTQVFTDASGCVPIHGVTDYLLRASYMMLYDMLYMI